jgi:antirestriction protein ArdC
MASLNVYEMVTERIIKQLEQGTIPWQKFYIRANARSVQRSCRQKRISRF